LLCFDTVDSVDNKIYETIDKIELLPVDDRKILLKKMIISSIYNKNEEVLFLVRDGKRTSIYNKFIELFIKNGCSPKEVGVQFSVLEDKEQKDFWKRVKYQLSLR